MRKINYFAFAPTLTTIVLESNFERSQASLPKQCSAFFCRSILGQKTKYKDGMVV
jgi:hypothetical protein